jgi:hypothetical protein
MAKICCFLSLLFTGLTLGPGMAHLLEMPHKMALSMQDYKIVQTIYRGWALMGIMQTGAVLFMLILIFDVRRGAGIFFMTLAAFRCLASALVTFYIHLSRKYYHQQPDHITLELDAAQATMGVFTFHRYAAGTACFNFINTCCAEQGDSCFRKAGLEGTVLI